MEQNRYRLDQFPNSINEIGCIHTTQGFDLNYAGIILGPEIDYDNEKNRIFIYKKRYKDNKEKWE